VLVLMTGCVALVVNLVRAPIAAANEFTALVDDGELELAYDSLCRSTRSQLSLEEFSEQMSAAGGITGYTLTSASPAFGQQTSVTGTIEIDEQPRNINFDLTRENDRWRVCTYDPIQ
jgi:hypothetical protein